MAEYRYCPLCGMEYRQGFEKCAECGVHLIDEAPDLRDTITKPKPKVLDPSVDLVEVFSGGAPDAEMVRAYLAGHGVEAILTGDEVGGYSFTVGALGQRTVLVRSDQASAAHELILDVNPPPEQELDPMRDGRLGFSGAVLVAIAVVIVVGIVLAYMPGN